MPDLAVWPTDGAGPGGDGSVSSEARWRKMARLWIPNGVDASLLGVGGGAGALAPTLQAGPAIAVAPGSCWLDGHYAEMTAGATVPASANGLLVVRFTPADNHAELLYRDAATDPTRTLATWELPIAQMTAGAMADRRVIIDPLSGGMGYLEKVPTGNLVCTTATTQTVPGSAVTLTPGRWVVTAFCDTQVSASDVNVYNYAWPDLVAPTGGATKVSGSTSVVRGIAQAFGRFTTVSGGTFDVKAPTAVAIYSYVTGVTGGVSWTIIGTSSRLTATRVGPTPTP